MTTNIMPLGDSVTYGTGSFPRFGYRYRLWQLLRSVGYDFNFIGGQANDTEYGSPSADFLPDSRHEGHPGYRADEIADGLPAWLAANPPDVILLHVGTNDISSQLQTDALDVEEILDIIDAFDTSIVVVVALIINRATASNLTSQFNANVKALVEDRIANDGDLLKWVDMEHALTYPDDIQDPATSAVHPNESGYNKMAEMWLGALRDVLPAPTALRRRTLIEFPEMFDTPDATDETLIWDASAEGLRRISFLNFMSSVLYTNLAQELFFALTIGTTLKVNKSVLTIASPGEITVTRTMHDVETEGGAASDDLYTIFGGDQGQLLVLGSYNSAHDVTLKQGGLAADFIVTTAGGSDFWVNHEGDFVLTADPGGNIYMQAGADRTLTSSSFRALFIYDEGGWREIV